MKKNSYTPLFKSICCLLLSLTMIACSLYEHPEMTENGEIGIDPTAVNVNINLSLQLKTDEAANDEVASRADAETGYRHRIIVDAYLNRILSKRQVVYKELTEAAKLDMELNLKLHARDYQLVIWADYVSEDSDDDLFYNTTTLAPVISPETYLGNSEYKDVLYSCQELNLSKYRNQWNAQVALNPEMKRPTARYELIANDIETFMTNGAKAGSKYTMTVRYLGFYDTGFHTLDGISKHGLQYVTYKRTITVPLEGTQEMSIAFDHIFVPENGEVPIAVELSNDKNALLARTYLTLQCKTGDRIVKRSNFLTADPSGGIGVDPGYDGTIDEDLTVE
ncbi:DUF6562 domain-containing protein [Bacteroides eggerthii]|jgi:hypothetical protein|uniref:DUF6562 domain-containing protein n=1 Tax=Bacteroides eggerthii TaxID=28111 RepID=UPI0011060E72|nr:DUF6562 domain-containing protein [Bacteroides eggerthii]